MSLLKGWFWRLERGGQVVGPSAFVYVPRDTPYTFQVKSETVRWFGVGIAGHLGQWFFETGELGRALTLLPPPTQPPNASAIIASMKAYGIDTLGPPGRSALSSVQTRSHFEMRQWSARWTFKRINGLIFESTLAHMLRSITKRRVI